VCNLGKGRKEIPGGILNKRERLFQLHCKIGGAISKISCARWGMTYVTPVLERFYGSTAVTGISKLRAMIGALGRKRRWVSKRREF
jgi:hypothetical protein